MNHPPFQFAGESTLLSGDVVRLTFSVTAVLLCALAGAIIARRASAAVRHKIWSLATLVALLLPAALLIAPEYRLGLVGSDINSPEPPHRSAEFAPAPVSFPEVAIEAPDARPLSSTPPPLAHVPQSHLSQFRSFSTASLLLITYAIPAAALIFRLIFGAIASQISVRRAMPVEVSTDGPSIPVLESPQVESPVCVGYFRPAILLPTSWRNWSSDQLRAVLTHERAHVARRDVLWQAVARLACALYWPHPLIWYAARRMRIEREFACDDSVLRAGASPTRYSSWLLDLACGLRAARVGIAMAGRAGLPARVEAALNPARSRNPVSSRFSLASSVLAAILLFLSSTLSPLKTVHASAEKPEPPAPSTPATQPSVLLVTEGNLYLQEMIESLHLSLSVTMLPKEYDQLHPRKYDVVIFDRYTPRSFPTVGKFVYVGSIPPQFNPSRADITIAQDLTGNPITVSGQKALRWDHDHPVLKNLSLDRLWVNKALKLKLGPDATSLVDGTKGSLIAMSKDGRRTNVVIGFDVMESSWPLDLSFPIFWNRLIPFLAAEPNPRPASQPAASQPADARPRDASIRFLSGRVVDSTGKGVPAARVIVMSPRNSFSERNATTDADGRFVVFMDVKPPQILHLRAQSPDGKTLAAFQAPFSRTLKQADVENITLTLKPAAAYPVIVTDANDRPVNRASVIAVLGPNNRIEVLTDATGKATLSLPYDTPPTSIIVTKNDAGLDYVTFQRGALANQIESPRAVPGETLHFSLNAMRTVSVTVTDHQFRPLTGVQVRPRSLSKPGKSPVNISAGLLESPETNVTGTAKISLPADLDRPVVFTANFPGYVQSTYPAWDPRAQSNQLTLVMKPLTRYHLAVLDPDGKPAPYADAMLVEDHGGQNYGTFNNGRVGADATIGGFLLPDTFYMFAAMKGNLASDPVMQIVRAGGPELRIELKLKPAVRVHGQLTAGTPPKPAANSTIYIQFDDGDAYKSLRPDQRLPADVTGPRDIHPAVMFNRTTDKDGNFQFYLAPGTYHLFDPAEARGGPVPAAGTFVVNNNDIDIKFDFHYTTQRPARPE